MFIRETSHNFIFQTKNHSALAKISLNFGDIAVAIPSQLQQILAQTMSNFVGKEKL